MIYLASFLIGAAVGLISVTIFAVILRRLEERNSKEAVRTLTKLIYVILGAGLTDYVIFDVIIKCGALEYYIMGFTVVFLSLGFLVFFDWRK